MFKQVLDGTAEMRRIDVVLLANSGNLLGRNISAYFDEKEFAVTQHDFIRGQIVVNIAERDEQDLVAQVLQRSERIHGVDFDKARQMAVPVQALHYAMECDFGIVTGKESQP